MGRQVDHVIFPIPCRLFSLWRALGSKDTFTVAVTITVATASTEVGPNTPTVGMAGRSELSLNMW